MTNKKYNFTVLFLLTIFVIGLIQTWFTWGYIKDRLSDEALEQARIIARSINVEDIQKLSGNSGDLIKYEYISIRSKLQRIREGHSSCRFLYLMDRKADGSVIFLLDSQQEGSKDAVTPGLIYEEVPEEYIKVFNSGIEQTVGPIEDRWGRLVTSLIPIYEKDNPENMIAILGMDIDVDDWYYMIFSQIVFPFIATIFILLLIILLYTVNRNRIKLKIIFKEKEATVKELETALSDVKELRVFYLFVHHANKLEMIKAIGMMLKYI